MPRPLLLFRCAGEAVVAKGLRGLLGLVPFGEQLFDVAADACDRYRHHCKAEEIKTDVELMGSLSTEEVKAQAAATVEEIREAGEPSVRAALEKPEVREALTGYLTQLPSSIRRSLRRPLDPSGTTVPSGFGLRKPEDMLELLPPSRARFAPGDRPVGNWVLTELLGIGGFGEVWKAEHPTVKGIPPVALKFCLDPEAANVLRHEAAVLSMVMRQRHVPGVVTLRNAWLDNEPLCLEYEYVNGGDLHGLLIDWRNLDPARRPEQAARVVRSLAGTVGHFHRLDPPVVHRDLKPANILVERTVDGSIGLRIADFGIGGPAAAREIQRNSRGVSRGDLLASLLRGSHTPMYASPQQVRGEPPDPRDDVHALGVIWFQLLTGNLGQGPGNDYAEDLRELSVPEGMISLLGRCTASRLERRPADAQALAEQMEAIGSAVAPPVNPPITQSELPAAEQEQAPVIQPTAAEPLPEETGAATGKLAKRRRIRKGTATAEKAAVSEMPVDPPAYQLTQSQFVDRIMGYAKQLQRADPKKYHKTHGPEDPLTDAAAQLGRHEHHVRRAVNQGLDVPEIVLQRYPKLMERAAKKKRAKIAKLANKETEQAKEPAPAQEPPEEPGGDAPIADQVAEIPAYQLTPSQFMQRFERLANKLRRENPEKYGRPPFGFGFGDSLRDALEQLGGRHDEHVRRAIERGLEVPDKVLRRYPELRGAANKNG
jgi:serine/threonine protein kinase